MTAPSDQFTILIVDDHEAVLGGTVSALQTQYPDANVRTAATAKAVNEDLARELPDLLIMDLSIPVAPGKPSQTEVGIALLRQLLDTQSSLNIVVQSAHVKSLVRLKPAISDYPAGFTITDKNLPLKDMLEKVDWARKGLIYTPRDMRTRLEIKPEWMKMLQLAFVEGLQDKAIASSINVSERTVRHYWNKVQDALGVYPEAGKNIRIQTEIRAREEGLID